MTDTPAVIPSEGNAPGDPLVTVIIPVYNCERFLARCLDSVIGQTMPDFEVIAVNDGSTDRSLEILREYETREPRLRVIDQANAGQGAARNLALDRARGEYILFVDSDDFIESVTLQVTTERAEEDRSDLVHFDWKFASSDPLRPEQYDYYNVESFWEHRLLEDQQCELLFRMHSYFSVVNLYRRSFLDTHKIRFETGQIYEDNPFLAKAITRATTVSLVHSPLYIIQANPESSTKTGSDTDRHMRDHLAAVRKSFDVAEFRSSGACGDLAEYHLEKFVIYYERRVPKRYRGAYAREFVEILASQPLRFEWLGRKTSWLTRACIALKVFERMTPRVLERLVLGKSALTPPTKKLLSGARKVKRRARHPLVTVSNAVSGRKPALEPGTVLFLGFDSRYTGNSRALFEQLLEDNRLDRHTIRFATDDTKVPASMRLKPDSLELLRFAQRAEYVIAETWVPLALPKHPESTWIQLWHGTPIKRMLFDSNEPEIISRQPRHKVNKYKDILRWDYLVVDGEEAASAFETAFLFPRARMLDAQYPRVQWLIQKREDENQIREVKERLGVGTFGPDCKFALYAPTWRDYNYGRHPQERDFSYLLDLDALSRKLAKEWVIIFKDHNYLGSDKKIFSGQVVDGNDADFEELMAVSDCLITDYSSAVFDARRSGTPIVLYASDRETFEESRGVYLTHTEFLDSYATTSIDEIADMISDVLRPIEGSRSLCVDEKRSVLQAWTEKTGLGSRS